MKKLLFQSSVLMLLLALSGCGGTKVLKEPEPLVVTQSLATASDQYFSATLDWVIVRDGPGTWAKNVDWDEYLIGVQNLSNESLEVTNITVVDSLGTRIEARENRKQLVKGTKKTKRRYKGEGLKVKAGLSGGVLMAGAGVGVAIVGATVSIGPMMGAAAGGGAAAGATVAAVGLLVPVLAVGGIVRAVNNSKVNNQIESRQTLLPVVLQEEEEKNLDIFFPLAPSPRQIEITYASSQGDHTLIIDTRTALDGLHLVQAEE